MHRRRRASLPDEPSVARAQAKLEKREEKEEEEEEEDKKSAVGVAQPAVPGRAVATSASSPPPSSPPPPLQVPATPPPTPPPPPRAGSPCTPVAFSLKEVDSGLLSQLEDVALDPRPHASDSGECPAPEPLEKSKRVLSELRRLFQKRTKHDSLLAQ